ncbi:hypothetical protein [Flavobacterium sp. GCM10023249]|uniref:hypothetical protein n=1 Tax=unclassified Flavobacterium TaxID=196869 RepID=UPI00361B01DE
MKTFKYKSLSKEHKSKYWFDVFKAIENNKEDNRTLILITHGFLEIMTEILINELTKNKSKILNNGSIYSYSVRLLILNEMGVIGDYRYCLLDYFRQLRNKAAHEALFKIELLEIKDYVNSLEKKAYGNKTPLEAKPSLESKSSLKSKTFKEFCIHILVTFWVDHSEIFAKSILGIDNE